MNKKTKTFFQKAKSWAARQKLVGPSAFSRFVMMTFVDHLNQVSDEFVFKGGNLLWVYIRTPRATVDLDLVTRTMNDHDLVRGALNAVCKADTDQIVFSLKEFKPVETDGAKAAAVVIAYRTSEGQENTFDLDIVYAVPTAATRIQSPLDDEQSITVATMENIIADKLSASKRYGSGNTRMKDFDDLWRISKMDPLTVNWSELKTILESRLIPNQLDPAWVTPNMIQNWSNHCRRNRGLPEDLQQLMDEVNSWLSRGLK